MQMFDIKKVEIEWGGRTLTLETGRLARQAHGAVLATYGETVVLCAVTAAAHKPAVDFFPLTVHYQEKTFAAGKIPGGFFKREGRPSEKETLTSRLIDRPIRPLFHKNFRNDTQVVCTVLSHDLENDPDILALVATSAALTISGLPFLGPIGAARVGYFEGEYRLNPMMDEMPVSELDLIVAGTQEGVLMVESEASELSEEVMLGAVTFGHTEMQKVIDAIIDLAEQAAKEPWSLTETPPAKAALAERLKGEIGGKLLEAYGFVDKTERRAAIDRVKQATKESLGDDEEALAVFGDVFKQLESEVVRGSILDTGRRIDG
ncbi:MAG: polyribonucleotide nucleotidyltransferase, partial [Tistlia sp.]